MHQLLYTTLLCTLLAAHSTNHAMERSLLYYRPKSYLEVPKEQLEKDAKEFVSYVESFRKNLFKTMVAAEREHVTLSETQRNFLIFASLENSSLQGKINPHSVYEKICMFSPTSVYNDTQRFWQRIHPTEKYGRLYQQRLNIIVQYAQFFNRLVQEGKISPISIKAAL